MGRTKTKIVPVALNPLDLTDAALRARFGSLPDAELIRTLILTEAGAIRNGAAREERTMRNVWYDHIKPVLSRAGRLGDKTSGGKDVNWEAKLSVYLTELVRAGETSYAELRIVDGSRQRRAAAEIVRQVATVRLVGGHYPWLVIFSEKDTIWGEIETLAGLYGVSAISGGGEPANACTADMVRAILASDAYHGEDLVLLTLTDYDPSGYIIAGAQHTQLQESVGDGCTVYHERLGLTPDQLTRAERDAKAYKPKEKGLEDWLTATGGVDGRPLGLELDALPLSRLRAMFAAGIERYIDLGPRRADLREAFLELLAWDLLRPQVEAQKAAMVAAVKRNGLWARIQQTALPDNLFRLAAGAGWDAIDPTAAFYADGRTLFDCAADVRAAMATAWADAERL